jgi:hypothetical protein
MAVRLSTAQAAVEGPPEETKARLRQQTVYSAMHKDDFASAKELAWTFGTSCAGRSLSMVACGSHALGAGMARLLGQQHRSFGNALRDDPANHSGGTG